CWPHDRFALGARERLRIHVGLKLERDLCSAEPPPTLIDRLNFFFENFVKTVRSGDRHGSPTEQLLTVARLPSYPAEILDCKRSIARSRATPDARFLAIKQGAYGCWPSPSSSTIMRSITPSPPCQNAGSRASSPKGASSSEWCLVPPAASMSR